MAVQSVTPVAAGYVYSGRLHINEDAVVFPVGCQLRADVRPSPASTHLAGTLTTENGGLARVDDQTVEFTLSGEITASIGGCEAWFDLARVDLDPIEWVPLKVQLPVEYPITKPIS